MPSPAVPHRPRPSFTIPGRPHPFPAVLNRPRPSIPLPRTNMSHPVGPAVLPKDGRPALGRPGRTTDSHPVPSKALSSPPAGPRRAPGRLGTLRVASFHIRLPDWVQHLLFPKAPLQSPYARTQPPARVVSYYIPYLPY